MAEEVRLGEKGGGRGGKAEGCKGSFSRFLFRFLMFFGGASLENVGTEAHLAAAKGLQSCLTGGRRISIVGQHICPGAAKLTA
jgi:hypothetical protein